ncbi:MAG TPA: class I SAM-dependent methyltransferase [Anaerolineaceae bacterium]|nr:class I SAM-dependent methyltransferase [Anaerolineaceae bacterium]
MPEKINPKLGGVAETLLIPLYCRAIETQRPDALIKDKKALAIVNQLDCDFSRLRLHGLAEPATILRIREFDRMAREFLARNPEAVVVHIGCGLDTRFERVDNGRVEWFDLDLPEVIDLRRSLIGDEKGRYHLVNGSIFENAWQDSMRAYHGRPFLFIAEGVLPYFKEARVRSLVVTLRRQFPGAELVFDGISPTILWTDNLRLAMTKVKARLHWGLKGGKDLESWENGIQLLEEWFYFDHPEPRLSSFRWMRFFPFFAKSTGIFHYKLGELP